MGKCHNKWRKAIPCTIAKAFRLLPAFAVKDLSDLHIASVLNRIFIFLYQIVIEDYVIDCGQIWNDAHSNPESGEPALTFDNLDVRVRCHHDNQVTIYHPTALMRFEITKNNPEDVVEDIYNIADTANRQSAESALRFEGSVTDIREISDALLVDFDNPKSAINARSWSTTWYTLNIPSNIHGIRHPIMKFSPIVGQAYWMVRITEVNPIPGQQWYNVYNESSEEWSGWYRVNSTKV